MPNTKRNAGKETKLEQTATLKVQCGQSMMLFFRCIIPWNIMPTISFEKYHRLLNLDWNEGRYFSLLVPFWIRFCQLNVYQKFLNFFGVEN